MSKTYITPCPVGTLRQVQGLDPNSNNDIDCIMSNNSMDPSNTISITNLTPEQMILDVCTKFPSPTNIMNTDLVTGNYMCYTKFGALLDSGKINISFSPSSEPNTVNINCPDGYSYTSVSEAGVITCTRQSQQGFTSNILKSRKDHRVENFSQNTNGKCKARY